MDGNVGLKFSELAEANLNRAIEWHRGGIDDWSVSDWAVAMAGEAGEVCDAVKKLRRVEGGLVDPDRKGPHTREEAVKAIAMEIGDTAVYLDLLAQRLGLDLGECVVATFNRVSEREGLPQRIGAEGGGE